MDKPQLHYYMRRRVENVEASSPHEWKIVLNGGIEILNKDVTETFAPVEILGCTLIFISMSLKDTTLHFEAPNGYVHKIGLNPTQYAIRDPRYGGEAYPQWPVELEEAGIPSVPGGEVSAQPSAEWPEERIRLLTDADERRKREAQEFLNDEEGE